jgi:hypothetical protein
MTSYVFFNRRDVTRTYTLLAFAACVFSFLIFFAKIWPPVWFEISSRPQLNVFRNDGSEAIYTGSIIVPIREDLCREHLFDNRTGTLRDRGVVKCLAAASLPVVEGHTATMSTMEIIRKSFRASATEKKRGATLLSISSALSAAE